MPANPKPPKQKVQERKGKYTPKDTRRSCSLCKSLHEGGVNELCPFAAPHAVANYCHALNIPYPAELTKGSRPDQKVGPSQGATNQQPKQSNTTPKLAIPPKQPKKDIKGGKHSKLDPGPTPARHPSPAPAMPIRENPSVTQTPRRPTPPGPPPGMSQAAPQPSTPQLAPTHTFQEFCSEVTDAIQPAIAKIVQDTLGHSMPTLTRTVQDILTSNLQAQQQPPPPPPKQMPPQKRQRTDEREKQSFQLSDDENDMIQQRGPTTQGGVAHNPHQYPVYQQAHQPRLILPQPQHQLPHPGGAPPQQTAQLQQQAWQQAYQQPQQHPAPPQLPQPTTQQGDTPLATISGHLQQYLGTNTAQQYPIANQPGPSHAQPTQRQDNPAQWDNITITPLHIQPEHGGNQRKHAQTALAEQAAQTIMQAAGMTSEEADDMVARANTKKSGETRRCTDRVLLDIHWPHEKIHRLQGAHANYGNLSFLEFMAGSLTILAMSLPNAPALAPIIGQLDYLTKMSLEAHDQPWHLVRSAHREVLLSIEHGDLGLTDFAGWQALRKDTLERLKTTPGGNNSNNSIPPLMGANYNNNPNQQNGRNNRNRSQNMQTCRNYNNGSCFSHQDHNQPNSNLRWTHICSYCFNKSGIKSRHPQHICDVRKADNGTNQKSPPPPKNEKGGPKQA